MSTQQPILIIGGGIGGLASALALSRLVSASQHWLLSRPMSFVKWVLVSK